MYERALAIAIHAASTAAEQLVALKPTPEPSPRGIIEDGEIPVIDTRTEVAMRRCLSDAFPAWGILSPTEASVAGLASTNDAHERHVWVIEPGGGPDTGPDRAIRHLISVALLMNGVPVLGVVHAVSTPHGRADCFAWAKGCAEVVRNGTPSPRTVWPDTIDASTVVALPTSSEANPYAALKCVAPGRFLAVDNLAYRLALAAIGEADASVSYSTKVRSGGPDATVGPQASWEYCAGHALLIGAGGTLVDQDGVEISYTADGASSRPVEGVFAGSAEMVRTLAERPWRAISEPATANDVQVARVVPPKTSSVHPVTERGDLSRAQGCLLGQFAGDALGSLVEFKSAAEISRMYPTGGPFHLVDGGHFDTIAGQPTDDSEMALMLARTLIDRGAWDAEATGAAYARWCHGWLFEDALRQHDYPHRARPFDIGNTTSMALGPVTQRDIEDGQVLDRLARTASTTTQANGALMRISPLGVWGACRPVGDVAEAARADASLTHPNRVCIAASATFAVTIAHAVRVHTSPRDLWEFARRHARYSEQCVEVANAIDEADSGPPEDFQTNMGWVLLAIRNAFHRLLYSPTLREGVIATVRAGGDTDTTAAIAGALLGAAYGLDAVPAQWRRMVLTCRPALMPASSGATQRIKKPRPPTFWPADALTVAQRLLSL